MSGVNKVILVGRLGTDPDVRSTPNGSQVCSLSIATSETWVKDGKREEKTEWHKVILWGRQAELAQKYLKKGRMVYIEGKLQTRNWQDKDGQKRYTTEVIANNLQFIDGAGNAGMRENQDNFANQDEPQNADSYYNNQGSHNQTVDPFQSSSSSNEDIPF